jgi:hypothetical protein
MAFIDIGQQYWAILIGLAAGWAARVVYARRPKSPAPAV